MVPSVVQEVDRQCPAPSKAEATEMPCLEQGSADLGGGAGVRIGWSALGVKGKGVGAGGDSRVGRKEPEKDWQ
jgi:hypothetical protein